MARMYYGRLVPGTYYLTEASRYRAQRPARYPNRALLARVTRRAERGFDLRNRSVVRSFHFAARSVDSPRLHEVV
jgi:hypothetical protein